MLKNKNFEIQLSGKGYLERLVMRRDSANMNWVIDPSYLKEVGYSDEDKLFGQFDMIVNGKKFNSHLSTPSVNMSHGNTPQVMYSFDQFDVTFTYDLSSDDHRLHWSIAIVNQGSGQLEVHDFGLWASVAYIMFRDSDVIRNMEQSCAVFPSISEDFTKLACVRRSHKGPHLGIYGLSGTTQSIGTYCRFENNFFKNVSPSLDGMLFHKLILVGSGTDNAEAMASDWLYRKNQMPLQIKAGGSSEWKYVFEPFENEEDFYLKGYGNGHPILEYTPNTVKDGTFRVRFKIPSQQEPHEIWIENNHEGATVRRSVIDLLKQEESSYALSIPMHELGEHKLSIVLKDGRTDHVIFNVSEPIRNIIETRVDYICNKLYQNEQQENPHAFLPISNQGESLGKLSLVLLKNLMGEMCSEQVSLVEKSAAFYIKNKWFVDGDLRSPARLYGTFYRIMDLDYIAHVFYLLSKFTPAELSIHQPDDYLSWAAEVMILRLDSNLHAEDREKKEALMLGVYILFIEELLQDLNLRGFNEQYARLQDLWLAAGKRLSEESSEYIGAVTEHFYDNAGFGPTCEALCIQNYTEEAERYGQLLLANIGYSNDFRSQNPDRWWEALSYMVHSLWGGLVAASALSAYEHLRRTEYLLAAYRATVAVLYCYDWNASATNNKLQPGEAASTYSVAAPNLNRPDLSRNRFGQGAFAKDGGLFAQLFGNASGDDWDMGEELAAYLTGFGKKTFLYTQDGEVRCANGEVIKSGSGYLVTSYAPYPREYYFFEDNTCYIAGADEDVRTIYYDQGTFNPVVPVGDQV
ncbi:hypothetical protein D3C71_856820 [compost metagenome]